MIYQGDCLDILPTLEPKSIQCCVTSPPYYGLRDYGTATWKGGDTGCDHKAGRFERGGLSSKQSSNAGSGGDEATGICPKCGAIRIDSQIGLEPTPDAYVEKLVAVFREVRRVLRDDGVLWLNLGDSYAGSGGTGNQFGQIENGLNIVRPSKRHGLKPKDLIGIPWRVAFALQADGWYLRQDIIWHKPNPMPESVTDRCTKSHEYIFLLTKSARYFYDAAAVSEEATSNQGAGVIGRGGQSSAKAVGCNGRQPQQDHSGWMGGDGETRNRRSVWNITTKPYKEAHFATFPEEIPRTCILAGSKKGDTILDPFSGAGTTGVVAEKLDRKYIGIELNPQYTKLAEDRIWNVQPLFAGV
jgi:DNA modification methylase